MNIIEVTNVSKKLKSKGKEVFALGNVSFNVKKGEIFGLLGPNGAGKTTMVNILLNVLVQDKGTVSVFGKRIGTDTLEKMNLVSGDIRFQWTLSSKQILEFYGRIYGLTKKEREKRISKLSKLFEIDHFMNRRFSYLSTGERMRLNFAKAMLNKPSLLLLDEPTLGLDPDIAIKVREEIKRVNKKFGTTILLTSHYMNEVEQLCDRIAFMDNGEIAEIGSVRKVLTSGGLFDMIVKVTKVKKPLELRARGFKIRGKTLRKQLKPGESLSTNLSFLSRNGIQVLDVETKRPTLEDYFVRVARRKA